jgi:exodeoxyribonuclease VII small subunit
VSKKRPTFEEALQQLETIAAQIERGEIGLEESIQKYEEGMSLVRLCRETLAKAEMKIQELQQKADGTLEPADVAGPTDDEASDSVDEP